MISKRNKLLAVWGCVALSIVILTIVLLKVEQSKSQKAQNQLVIQHFKHDVVIQGELRDSQAIVDAISRESQACERLGIKGNERKKRIEAVYKAGLAEEARVRATHYKSAFQSPTTD